MASNVGFEVEFSAEEEDPGSVVFEDTETVSGGLERLDATVETFGDAALICQQESPFNGDEPGGRLDQAGRCEFSRTVHLDLYAMVITESLDDKVKVTITGCQHGDITLPSKLNHVKRNADVPVTLRGPIASPNERFELHFEADGLEDLLEPDLLWITAIDGIREGMDDLPSRGHGFPERRIVEVTSMALPHRVKDVLHVHKDRNTLHQLTCLLAGMERFDEMRFKSNAYRDSPDTAPHRASC